MLFYHGIAEGWGIPRQSVLADLVRINSSDIVFLCETKSWAAEMSNIQSRLKFYNGVWVDAIGRSGGMALLWSNEVDLRIRALGDRYINFELDSRLGESWRGTGIYGWSDSGQKWILGL